MDTNSLNSSATILAQTSQPPLYPVSTESYLKILDSKYDANIHGEFDSSPHDFGFELDSFQKHAIMAIKRGENVLVTAHTGSGKTVPAIYGIADSLQKNRKIIYTSPIKSLSNQKLFELKKKFPDVGILTGDIKYNPDAQCVIMTTEILRNILYQCDGGGQHVDINEVDKVIFDEVHYINDPDRGRVWEECMILMPRDITLIMLSATIDRADEFASWIGTIKQKTTNLIPTTKRVVPLEHYYFLPKLNEYTEPQGPLIKIASSGGAFQNYNSLAQNYEVVRMSVILNKLVDFLQLRVMTPALFFVFSRKECERMAKGVHKTMVSSEEAGEINKIFNYELRHYKHTYEKSEQYQELHRLMLKGIAYHHSGLIPILKEVIEILFEKGLIKLLFATETFAVGVNAPTKTVVFPRLTKYSNNGFRYLRTDEYLQMAGRAGRRGLDKFGTVILLPLDELMEYATLKKMITGKSPSINSKFRLNYQFLLKIITKNEHNLDTFLRNSLFSKDNSQEISCRKAELAGIQSQYNEGVHLSTDELKLIKDYFTKKTRVDNLRGNNKKKELMKLNQIKRDIRNFEQVESKYATYLELEDQIVKLTRTIEYLDAFIYEDISKMVQYLLDNNYVTLDGTEDATDTPKYENIKLLLKGVIASGISECNEIILTEIVTNNFFLDLKPPEIIAILAAFIEEKSNDVTMISNLCVSDEVKEALNAINYISQDFGDYEYSKRIDIGTDWNLYLSFIGPAYDWSQGKSIYELKAKYSDIYEGTFIRNILRIHNMIENLKNIASIINNSELLKLLENLEPLLIRDQVITDSLYITKE